MKDLILVTRKELEELIEASVRKVFVREQQDKKEPAFDKPLTLAQACEFLNLKAQTIYGLTSARTIPFFKKGKKLYFRHAELVTWLSEGRKETRAEITKELELRD